MTDLIPCDVPGNKDGIKYYRYTCSECGKEASNTYCEPHRTRMLEKRHCFSCDYWWELEQKLAKEHATMTIIEGHLYTPGNRTSGSFRGMAGRRFDIEYIGPSAYAGQRITTFDLWSGSTMPDKLKQRFSDTAKFLGGAEKAQVGETTCWNPTMTRDNPYPPPSSLRPAHLSHIRMPDGGAA